MYLMAWNTRADKSAYRNPEVSAATRDKSVLIFALHFFKSH
jgi:hypothetical protein